MQIITQANKIGRNEKENHERGNINANILSPRLGTTILSGCNGVIIFYFYAPLIDNYISIMTVQ